MFLKCFNDAAVSGIVADVLNSLYSLGSLVTLACLPQFLGIAFNTGPLHWLILCVSSTGLPSQEIPRQLVKLFLSVTVRVFGDRWLAFESLDRVKSALSGVGERHAACAGPNRRHPWKKSGLALSA